MTILLPPTKALAAELVRSLLKVKHKVRVNKPNKPSNNNKDNNKLMEDMEGMADMPVPVQTKDGEVRDTVMDKELGMGVMRGGSIRLLFPLLLSPLSIQVSPFLLSLLATEPRSRVVRYSTICV